MDVQTKQKLNGSLITLTKDVIELAQIQRRLIVQTKQKSVFHEAVTKAVVIKQYESIEGELVESLMPIFQQQVEEIVTRLGVVVTKDYGEDAHVLGSLVFDPQNWTEKLKDVTLPIIALNMARAGMAQLLLMNLESKQLSFLSQKDTTGSGWLDEESEDYDDLLLVVQNSSVGTTANVSFLSEIPVWMKVSIVQELNKSFSQDYWEDISRTTMGDAEKIIKEGLLEGWSIPQMSRAISKRMGDNRYTRKRSTKIARTESTGPLNGTRKESINQANQIPGNEGLVKSIWLSVLAPTTRDPHANLDGVPADEDGMWNLDGYVIPWPGHYTLPPEHRCNCMCSIYAEIGMTNAEAQQLIGQHTERVVEMENS